MKNKILLSLLVVSAVFFLQCKDEHNTNTTNVAEIREFPKDFVEFLDTFSKDSIYQLNHIVFPLEGEVRAPGENVDSMIPYKWRKYKWQLHHEFNNYDSIFTRKFIIFNENTIIEKTTAVNGLFQMERRFAKMGNDWNLIYYSVN